MLHIVKTANTVPKSFENYCTIKRLSGRGDLAQTEKSIFDNAGIDFKINESFMSISAKNVVRGLHFQLHNSQAKVVCAFGGLGCNS